MLNLNAFDSFIFGGRGFSELVVEMRRWWGWVNEESVW